MDRVLSHDDIVDGSTIALLEVRDDRAQIWTKPDAFVPDPSDLRASLGGHINGEFLMVTANGRISYWPLNMAANEFARRLTRDAGD